MSDKAQLAPCPCGEIPTELNINLSGDTYALISGDCCDEWSIEVWLDWHSCDSNEIDRCAREAWNNAPRGKK